MSQLAILDAFAELQDPRRRAGQRHNLALCLALFTLARVAGNKGFLAIGDWIASYRDQLIDLLLLTVATTILLPLRATNLVYSRMSKLTLHPNLLMSK